MIASLLYTSTAAANIDSGDVFAIIEASARRNPSRGVTGFLIYDGRAFLQYVEGPQDALDDLLGQLAEDRRHGDVRILHRAESGTRLFPKWAMRRAGQGLLRLPCLVNWKPQILHTLSSLMSLFNLR